RVHAGTPGGGELVGSTQHDGGPLVERHRGPLGRGGLGCGDCVTGIRFGGGSHGAEYALVVVRLHDVDVFAGTATLLPADRHLEVVLLRRHLLDGGVELFTLGRAGGVGEDRFVDRCGNSGDAVEHGCTSSGLKDVCGGPSRGNRLR